ncbi:Transcription factor [Porphyridium purpureum]|uniref:Transcription factor n=1 Tax=Porphyridium purpureum TaxID=35688 RepID=A0A5J4Z792_PORPP|nr:Transcription factor [Porphyridium purpureum]|eukprot:POR5080..scf295_1
MQVQREAQRAGKVPFITGARDNTAGGKNRASDMSVVGAIMDIHRFEGPHRFTNASEQAQLMSTPPLVNARLPLEGTYMGRDSASASPWFHAECRGRVESDFPPSASPQPWSKSMLGSSVSLVSEPSERREKLPSIAELLVEGEHVKSGLHDFDGSSALLRNSFKSADARTQSSRASRNAHGLPHMEPVLATTDHSRPVLTQRAGRVPVIRASTDVAGHLVLQRRQEYVPAVHDPILSPLQTFGLYRQSFAAANHGHASSPVPQMQGRQEQYRQHPTPPGRQPSMHGGLGSNVTPIQPPTTSGTASSRSPRHQASSENSSSWEAGKAHQASHARRPYSRRQYWTPEEDEMLRVLVDSMGPADWPNLSAKMSGRTSKQCRERWLNHLQPSTHKSAWTAGEDALLAIMHSQHGNKWRLISQHMPGRSDNDIKNRFHVTLRRLHRLQRAEVLDTESAFTAGN